MSRVILILIVALVLLGFLSAVTMNMRDDMERLRAENQKLSSDLNQLRADYQTINQERDTARAENTNLQSQLNGLQTAYQAENQARIKAESDAENYKRMVLNLAKNVQPVSPTVCLPAEPQAIKPEELVLSTIAPMGVSSLLTLAIARLLVAVIQHARKQKKVKNLPTRLNAHRLSYKI